MTVVVHPLTPDRWDDLESIFNAKGCSVARGCWCMYYRRSGMRPDCILLGVAISLGAVFVLLRVQPERRLRVAAWISFYFTVPFAILDWLYCGVYLKHGTAFLGLLLERA